MSEIEKDRVVFSQSYRNQKRTVILEFPKQSNQAANDALEDRLKELYFRKSEKEAGDGYE